MRPIAPLAAVALLFSVAPTAHAGLITIDANAATTGTNVSSFYAGQGVTLSAVNAPTSDVFVDFIGFLSANAFAYSDVGLDSTWFTVLPGNSPIFRAAFTFDATEVQFDFSYDFDSEIRAYDASNNLIGSAFNSGTFTSPGTPIRFVELELLSNDFFPDGAYIYSLNISTADAPPVNVVPEPASIVLVGVAGLCGLARSRRLRRPVTVA